MEVTAMSVGTRANLNAKRRRITCKNRVVKNYDANKTKLCDSYTHYLYSTKILVIATVDNVICFEMTNLSL